jgi:hypothetical protein
VRLTGPVHLAADHSVEFIAATAVGVVAPSALSANPNSAAPVGAHMLQVNGYAVNAETPLELLTDYLTPTELLLVRSH